MELTEAVDLGLEMFSESVSGYAQRSLTNGAGDRALASNTRVNGIVALESLITRIPDAFRAGGWDGNSALIARVEHDSHEIAAGREWSLRGAIAKATLMAPATSPDYIAADAAYADHLAPNEAVTFIDVPNYVAAKVLYMTEAMGYPAYDELADTLRNHGYQIESN